MLFSNKDNVAGEISDTTKSPNQSFTNMTCLIAKGTTIEGKFHSTADARIDGKLIGSIECDQKLMIGADAYIQGNIIAKTLQINGKIIGDIKGTDLVHLEANAYIEGDVTAAQLQIEEGAVFTGKMKIVS